MVQRYSTYGADWDCETYPDDKGELVKYEDYEALEREVMALRKERERVVPVVPVEPVWKATKYPVSRPAPGAKLIVWDETGKFVGYGSAVDTRESGVAIQMSDGRMLDSNHDLRWQYALQKAPPAQPVAVPDELAARHAYESHVKSQYQYPMLERHPDDAGPWSGEYKEATRQLAWEDWLKSWNACRAAMLAAPVAVPDGIHPDTADLVTRFAAALAEKLHKAEQKYGYSNGWMRPDWYNECLQSLWEHIEKGDPRDVAAYCAFMWHHGWVTTDYDRNVPDAYRAAMLAAAPGKPEPVVVDALERFAEFMTAESIKSGDYPDGWQCKAANAAHDYAQACRAAMLGPKK